MYKPNEEITQEILNLMTFIEEEDSEEALKIIQEIARLSFTDGTLAILSTIENK